MSQFFHSLEVVLNLFGMQAAEVLAQLRGDATF
jgi:hypothetical protein